MIPRGRLLVLGIVLLFVATSADAFLSRRTEGTQGPALLTWGVGNRASSLGGAYAGVADDASALYWNPAGLNQLTASEVLLMDGGGFGGQRHRFLGYARPLWWRGDRRTLALGVDSLTQDALPVYEDETVVGNAHPYQASVHAAWSGPLGPWQSGVGLKYVAQKIYQESSSGYAADMGLMGRFHGGRGRWGAALVNLGPPISSGGRTTELPASLRVGASHPAGAWLWTGQVEFPSGGRPFLGAGVEYARPLARDWRGALRVGARTSSAERWGLGAGLARGGVGVNYAFAPDGNLGDSHRMEIVFRWGREPASQVRRRALLEEVRGLFAERKIVAAGPLLDELKALSPGQWEVRRLERERRRLFAESLEPETLFNLGYQAFQDGDFERSADFLEKLIAVNPGHDEARRWLVQAEAKSAEGRRARAREEVRRAREREVADLSARGESLVTRAEWERALEVWLRVDERGGGPQARRWLPRCREEVYRMAEQAQAAGDAERAAALFRLSTQGDRFRDAASRAASLAREAESRRRERAAKIYREGQAAYAAGDLTKARALFEEAQRIAPEDRAVRQALDHVTEELAPTSPAGGGKRPAGLK
jgi:tetratricopeptide (TPR) repeat protein